MDVATLIKSDPSLFIIEQDLCLDKSGEVLLPIFKRSRCLSIDDEFSDGVTKKTTWIETHTDSTTVVSTRLRS